MTAQSTPEQNERITKLVIYGVALLLFLLIAGITAFQTWTKYKNSQVWTPTTATIASIEQLCTVEHKSGKNWKTDEVTDCGRAAAMVAEKDSVLTPYRSTPSNFVNLNYEAGGSSQTKRIYSAFVGETAVAGSTVQILFDPAAPANIMRPYSPDDTSNLLMVTGISGLIALLVSGLGWVIAKANRKRHERVLAAGAAPLSDGGSAAGIATAAPSGPLWSRAAGWLGIIVLVLGILLGAMALIGSLNGGNSQAFQGGVVIIVLAVGIWQLLRYVARLGRA